MHSFTFPLFNAFTAVLLFSHINSALTAAIAAAQPGYLPDHRHHHAHHHHQHHHHHHIRPAHITPDIKLDDAVNLNKNNNGYPSMPSVSSRIFTYGKLADKFLLVNDVYLKDGWQSSLEVANAEGTGEGSSSLRTAIIDNNSANSAGPGAETGVAYHYGHDHHQGADAQDATHHIEQRPKTIAQQPQASVAVAPSGGLGRGSPSQRPTLPHIKGCETLARVQVDGGMVSRLSSYASTIQTGLRRLINAYLSPFGGELRRTESSFGEEEFSLLIADYLWT